VDQNDEHIEHIFLYLNCKIIVATDVLLKYFLE